MKVGKKLTGGSIVVKTGSEEFVCKLAREYVEEAWKNIRGTSENAKTSRGRGVEILEPLQKILALFSQWKSKKNQEELLIPLMEREWDKKRKKMMKASGVENWPHNALRHTFVSSRLVATKNPVGTAYESGHTIGIMKSHYDAIVDPMVTEKNILLSKSHCLKNDFFFWDVDWFEAPPGKGEMLSRRVAS